MPRGDFRFDRRRIEKPASPESPERVVLFNTFYQYVDVLESFLRQGDERVLPAMNELIERLQGAKVTRGEALDIFQNEWHLSRRLSEVLVGRSVDPREFLAQVTAYDAQHFLETKGIENLTNTLIIKKWKLKKGIE